MTPLRANDLAPLNPYAPPQVDSSAEIPVPSLETLETIGPIRFAGVVDEQHLREFLSVDGQIGCGQMFMIAISFGVILLGVCLLGGGFTAIGIGGVGFVGVAMAVSTFRYRRLVFQNINPHWNRPTRGDLKTDGVHLERGQTLAFYRWDWYGGVVVSDQLVAFLPATQLSQPLLVTKSMLTNLDDWSRVMQVAAAIGILSDEGSIDDRRRQENLQIIRQRNRPRSLQLPDNAITFEGFLTVADFSRIPELYRLRRRPMRAYVVIAALLSVTGLVVMGISQIVFQQLALLPVIALAYVIVAVAFGKMRRRKDRRDAVYYLNAFATESSIVTDFAITTMEVPWSAVQPAVRTDEFVALRRRQWMQFIVARRNMFASDETWRRFNQWVDQTLPHT